jgi:biotin carboxyl carrier protein
VTAIGDGWYLVSDGVRQWQVAIAAAADGTWVFVDGQSVRLDPEPAAGGRPRGRSRGDAGVMSPMPATVVAVHASAGQAVNEGDTLVLLEAMKMELPIRAPRAGVVKSVNCAPGELVQPGVNLIEFE